MNDRTTETATIADHAKELKKENGMAFHVLGVKMARL